MPLLHEPLHHLIEFSCLVRHVEAGGRLSESFTLLLNFEDVTHLFMKLIRLQHENQCAVINDM